MRTKKEVSLDEDWAELRGHGETGYLFLGDEATYAYAIVRVKILNYVKAHWVDLPFAGENPPPKPDRYQVPSYYLVQCDRMLFRTHTFTPEIEDRAIRSIEALGPDHWFPLPPTEKGQLRVFKKDLIWTSKAMDKVVHDWIHRWSPQVKARLEAINQIVQKIHDDANLLKLQLNWLHCHDYYAVVYQLPSKKGGDEKGPMPRSARNGFASRHGLRERPARPLRSRFR